MRKNRTGWIRGSAVGIAAFLAALPGAAAQPAPISDESHAEVTVRVLDRAGSGVSGLEAADLEVVEDGRAIAPSSLEPVDDWRVVVFLDQVLSTSLVVKSGALEIGRQAEALTRLGAVEVVLGGEEIARSLPPTRDPEVLNQALSWIAVREGGLAGQLEIRRRFLDSPQVAPLVADRSAAVSATAGRRLAELSRGVRSALQDEADLVESRRLRLLDWLAAQSSDPHAPGPQAPRLLLYVSSGWDEYDLGFYERALKRISMQEAAEEATWPAVSPSLAESSSAVAAAGWVVIGFSPSKLIDPETAAELDAEAKRREEEEIVETVVQDGREYDRTILKPSLDPRDLFKKRGDSAIQPDLSSPLAPLERLADDSGGAVATDAGQLSRALDRLAGAYRLTYPTGIEPGALERIEVRPASEKRSERPPAEVVAPRWAAVFAPNLMSTVRARRLIEEELADGDLTVSATVAAGPGEGSEATLRVEWAGESEAVSPLRLTVAVEPEAGRAITTHRLLDPRSAAPVEELEGAYSVEIPFPVPLDPQAPTVVVVEDLGRGLWGSAYVQFEASTGTGDDSRPAGSYVLPAPKAVHLLAPKRQMVMGTTEFDTVVSDTRVARVDFLLDGELAVSRRVPPFSARLDLGPLPKTRRVEVVAYDVSGVVLARDALTLNEGSGSFRVRILKPSPEARGTETELRTGPIEVETAVRVPRGGRLDRLEFYWKDELVGTRYTEPFSERVVVPARSPAGFVRVVGYLDDGATTEDVVFVNSPQGSERVRVELVELYTVVTDRRGRPVLGLDKGDFKVTEDGKTQEISTFGDAADQPLTVGLAIDSSASMFVKLPEVQLAAASFLNGLATQHDRAFVVGFGDEAFLQKDTTSDLAAARRALFRLEPAGHTSIWKGIVYSLVQLQGVPGKKALIVYSDGADEDPDFSYRTCLEFARRVGVPLYVVVSNDEIYRTEGKGLTIRGFMNRLESLTRNVGGRVFVTRVGEDLEAIYSEIDREIRSQYLIGYYAQETDEESWRQVSVSVDAPGATARTIAGYYR